MNPFDKFTTVTAHESTTATALATLKAQRQRHLDAIADAAETLDNAEANLRHFDRQIDAVLVHGD